jgi:hypothetical protein
METTPLEDARAALAALGHDLEYQHSDVHRSAQRALVALRALIAEHGRLTAEVESDYLSIEDLGEAMSAASDRWDGDEAMHAIVLRFVGHYAALDAAIDSARAADDYDDTKQILFRWDSECSTLVLTAPPTDDEREARRIAIRRGMDSIGSKTWDETVEDISDRLHDAGFRRQGPITDEWEYGIRADGNDEPYSYHSDDLDWLLDGVSDFDGHIVRRRKAGPWEPVEAARDAS